MNHYDENEHPDESKYYTPPRPHYKTTPKKPFNYSDYTPDYYDTFSYLPTKKNKVVAGVIITAIDLAFIIWFAVCFGKILTIALSVMLAAIWLTLVRMVSHSLAKRGAKKSKKP